MPSVHRLLPSHLNASRPVLFRSSLFCCILTCSVMLLSWLLLVHVWACMFAKSSNFYQTRITLQYYMRQFYSVPTVKPNLLSSSSGRPSVVWVAGPSMTIAITGKRAHVSLLHILYIVACGKTSSWMPTRRRVGLCDHRRRTGKRLRL